MKFSHVVACTPDRVIGNHGKMPWHIPADLKLFRSITLDHIVIMGRKTFESIGKPLPQRLNIVVSQQNLDLPRELRQAHSLEEAMDLAEALRGTWGEEAFIVGGGQIYQQSMPIVHRIYLSQIPLKLEGDTFYPQFKQDEFQLIKSETIEAEPSFTFQIWQRHAKE